MDAESKEILRALIEYQGRSTHPDEMPAKRVELVSDFVDILILAEAAKVMQEEVQAARRKRDEIQDGLWASLGAKDCDCDAEDEERLDIPPHGC